MLDRGAVHREHAVRLQIEDPHGIRCALEHRAVLGFRRPQRGDSLLALLAQQPFPQGAPDGLGQPRQMVLQDVVGGARLHELDRFFLVERARNQNDRKGGEAFLDELERGGPVEPREPVVGQDDIRHEVPQRLLEAGARVHPLADELQSRLGQVAFDQRGVRRHVFQQQDP